MTQSFYESVILKILSCENVMEFGCWSVKSGTALYFSWGELNIFVVSIACCYIEISNILTKFVICRNYWNVLLEIRVIYTIWNVESINRMVS